MHFIDLLKETIWSISGNRVRSGLTILGIVIGIASVITMVAIGDGTKKSIEQNIESIGSNLIMIMPGMPRGSGGSVNQGRGSAKTLTEEDNEAIRAKVTDIKAIAPQISSNYQVVAGGKNVRNQVVGTTTDYPLVRNIKLSLGSFFSTAQEKNSAKVAVLGSTARDDLFSVGFNPVGQNIRINSLEFKIIGVTQAKGGTGFDSSDDSIFVPLSTANHYLSGEGYLNNISITVVSADKMSAVQEKIEQLLLERHKISDPVKADFRLMNQNDILQTASSITGTLTLLLSSIAGISLLVGGIGIMNMMLTTVTERTREIGLRKAVGIRKLYINLQFLAEASALTFLGGFLGILLGALASALVAKFSGLQTTISVSSVLLAFFVSAAVGIIFGFYPARRAANLKPIEALRYE
jgi:putative ABC transport system permease protein